ncbi:hypothetical protein [Thalassobacillus pellis]|uniref:hypothetical protein n=1 Tax=Thalassobacillus pellis TaxID=748008 RepID=UPI0019621E75|nr:hypothetical protein [Thalassobacillus pellis]MBM7554525.1 hypothetical protein [Thalassobacillus pellis]
MWIDSQFTRKGRVVLEIFVVIILDEWYVRTFKENAVQFHKRVMDYMAYGFYPEVAAEWANRGFSPVEAVAAIKHGHNDPKKVPDFCPWACD